MNNGFRQDIITLQGYSSIIAATKGTFEMHSLLHLVTKKIDRMSGKVCAANSKLWTHKREEL